MKKLLLFAILLSSFLCTDAQQLPIHNHFFINPYIYNPAFAGDHNGAVVYLAHRRQWMGIEGAPVTSSLSAHTPVGDKIALGLNVLQDEAGILKTSSALATFGYKVPFSKTHFIRFGLSAGVGFNSLDMEGADMDDQVLIDALDKNTFLDARFGVNYHVSGLNIGFALPRLIESPFLTSTEFNSKLDIRRLNRYLFSLSYRFGSNDSPIAFEPTVLYTMSDGTPSQYEAYGIFYLGKAVWVGASYRQDYGPTAYFGIKVKEMVNIGYAYELASEQVSSFSDGTHEIQLGIRLTKPKKPVKKPLTRPVPKTTITAQNRPVKEQPKVVQQQSTGQKPVVEQKPAVVEQKPVVVEQKPVAAQQKPVVVEQKPVAVEQKPVIVQQKPIVEQKPSTVEQKPIVAEQKPVVEQKKPEPKVEEQKPIVQKQQEPKVEKSKEWEVIRENAPLIVKETPKQEKPKEEPKPVVEEKKPVERLPAEEKQVIVKRGRHPMELEEGNYVVVGAFSVYENAERYKDQLFKEGFFCKFGYTTEKNYYYVYLYVSGNLQSAKKERDRLKKMSDFNEAWILTVE